MSVKLISYANRPFFKSQKFLKKSALRNGIDQVVLYNDIWLKSQTDFYKKNKTILDSRRGAGYWLWKPFIILDAINKMDEGDILIYIDSGASIVDNLQPLINLANDSPIILFYNNGHVNKTWTKRDCFFYMDCDERKFHDGFQVLAGYIVLKKTKEVIQFLNEWLSYAEDRRIITDDANTCGKENFEEFIDHRHDQSILSILAIRHNLSLYRDPSQWGNAYKAKEFRKVNEFLDKPYLNNEFTNSPYPTILNSHRRQFKLNILDIIAYYMINIKKNKTT